MAALKRVLRSSIRQSLSMAPFILCQTMIIVFNLVIYCGGFFTIPSDVWQFGFGLNITAG